MNLRWLTAKGHKETFQSSENVDIMIEVVVSQLFPFVKTH